MVEPKSVREVSIVVEEFKESVDREFADLKRSTEVQFSNLNTKFWSVITLMVLVLGSAWAIYKEVGEVKTDIVLLKRDAVDAKERLGRIEGKIEANALAAATVQTQVQSALARIETRQASGVPERLQFVPLVLDSKEQQLIRKAIPLKSGSGETFAKLGDVAPENVTLRPVPDGLVAEISRLKGMRFFLDEKGGAIVLVSSNDNRISAIVFA